MNVAWFFSSLYFYILESIVESLFVFAMVWLVVRAARIDDPAVRLRFYLLPLIIPSFLSPAAHVLLPWIQDSALIVQFERNWFPVATTILEASRGFSPFVLIGFGFFLFTSLAQWVLCNHRHHAWLNDHRVADAATYQRCARNLARLAPRFEMTSPTLILADQAIGPYAWSGTQTRIVMPHALIENLDDEELEAILAHELAHLKRGDTWFALLARLARDLMFFNPLAHWAYRMLAPLREEACDDLAVRVTDKPLALASSLLKAWRGQSTLHAAPWIHALNESNQIEHRVARLLATPALPKGCGASVSRGSTKIRQDDFVFATVALLLTLALSIV